MIVDRVSRWPGGSRPVFELWTWCAGEDVADARCSPPRLRHVGDPVVRRLITTLNPARENDRDGMTHDVPRRLRPFANADAAAAPNKCCPRARITGSTHDRIKHGRPVNTEQLPPKTHHVSGHAYLKTAGLIDFIFYFCIITLSILFKREHTVCRHALVALPSQYGSVL